MDTKAKQIVKVRKSIQRTVKANLKALASATPKEKGKAA